METQQDIIPEFQLICQNILFSNISFMMCVLTEIVMVFNGFIILKHFGDRYFLVERRFLFPAAYCIFRERVHTFP